MQIYEAQTLVLLMTNIGLMGNPKHISTKENIASYQDLSRGQNFILTSHVFDDQFMTRSHCNSTLLVCYNEIKTTKDAVTMLIQAK